MENNDLIRKSKYLSQLLRHSPEKLDLDMDQAGWVPVGQLSSKFTLDELVEITETDPKGRYQMDLGKTKIRATSGHSIPWVTPDLTITTEVPTYLYHGTSGDNVSHIFGSGCIKKMGRNYIHLTDDGREAWKVGKRHGTPAVIVLDAPRMLADGYKFWKPVTDRYYFVEQDIPVSYILEIKWTSM